VAYFDLILVVGDIICILA